MAGEKQLHPSGEELPSSHTPRITFLANRGAIHSCDDYHFLLPPPPPPHLCNSPSSIPKPLLTLWNYLSLPSPCLHVHYLPHSPHGRASIRAVPLISSAQLAAALSPIYTLFSLESALPHSRDGWLATYKHPSLWSPPPPSLLTQLPSTISIRFSTPPNTTLFLSVCMCMLFVCWSAAFLGG